MNGMMQFGKGLFYRIGLVMLNQDMHLLRINVSTQGRIGAY